MAKKRKGSKRRRRVGALGLSKKGTGMKLLALGAGYLLADTINTQIDKFLPKTTDAGGAQVPNQTIGYIGQIGLGGLLLMSKKESMIKTLAGGVLAGSGLKRALKSMGVISGYQSVPVIGRPRPKMSGYQSVPVIGNTVVPPQLSGKTPAQLQGYRVNGYTSAGSGVMGGYESQGSGISAGSVSGYMG